VGLLGRHDHPAGVVRTSQLAVQRLNKTGSAKDGGNVEILCSDGLKPSKSDSATVFVQKS